MKNKFNILKNQYGLQHNFTNNRGVKFNTAINGKKVLHSVDIHDEISVRINNIENKSKLAVDCCQHIDYQGENYTLLLFLAVVFLNTNASNCISAHHKTSDDKHLCNNHIQNLKAFIFTYKHELELESDDIEIECAEQNFTNQLKDNIDYYWYACRHKKSIENQKLDDERFFTKCLHYTMLRRSPIVLSNDSLPKSPSRPGVLSPNFVKSKFL